jgi:hypothetical protein
MLVTAVSGVSMGLIEPMDELAVWVVDGALLDMLDLGMGKARIKVRGDLGGTFGGRLSSYGFKSRNDVPEALALVISTTFTVSIGGTGGIRFGAEDMTRGAKL